MQNIDTITDALVAAQKRGLLPTALSTAELRELGAGVLGRSVFTARGTSAVFLSNLKKLLDQLAAGKLSEGQVRTALWELLDVLGYEAERGGFVGEELEPAVEGSLQDLKSFARRDLIVRTQRDLMHGAGQKMRGSEPDSLSVAPAWELVRVADVSVPRDWPARWVIAGGNLTDGKRMIALKGDPVWGELGGYGNFQDALGVDHPPFAFNSGMGWREVLAKEVRELGITGPDGETPEEWLESQPVTLSGQQPLPTPQVSLRGVDPAIIERFRKAVHAETGGKPFVFSYAKELEASLARAREAYEKKGGNS